jgi:hypothetical protein
MILVLLQFQKLAGHHADIKDGRKANSVKAGWAVGYNIYTILQKSAKLFQSYYDSTNTWA